MIKIVTDSTSDLSKEVIKEYDIEVIPLRLFLGEKEFLDGIDMDPDQFYDTLRSSNDFPYTKSPSVETFVEKYRQILEEAEQIISIHISSKMSETCEIASLAKRKLKVKDGRIVVIDSKSASFGLGLQVIKLARISKDKERLSQEEVRNFETEVVEKNRVIFGVANLDFLKRSGRLGIAEKLVGSLLGQKPVLAIENGEIVDLGKVSNRKEFPQQIFNYMKQELDEGRKIKAGVIHWKGKEEASELKNMIENYFDCQGEVYLAVAGSVIGAHTGFGPVGVAYFPV